MARWRLTAKHYLTATREGEPTQWVREETNRDTGRTNRKTFDVPLYLDPDSGADQNYPGEIIVAHAGKGHPRDIIFSGPPTPDMEPLDPEAEAITEKEKANWVHPIESLPGNGGNYSEALLAVFTKQLEAAMKQASPVTAAPNDFETKMAAMQKQIDDLAKINAALQARVAAPAPTRPPAPAARV